MTRKIKFNITEAHSGAAFTVKVVTRSQQTELAGVEEDGSLRIRLVAPSAEGPANDELIAFLADALKVEPHQLELVAGASSRTKLISVEGVSPDKLEALFNPNNPS
jgi:uncharacterized protein